MTNTSGQPPRTHPNRLQAQEGTRPRGRRGRRLIVALLVTIVAVYFTYTPIISSIIARQLQNAVDTRLHAQLTFDSLTYGFPYHVRIENARIKTDETLGGEDLFTIAQLDLTLARLPLPRRPVVIRSLELKSPSVHLVRGGHGIVGVRGLQKTEEEIRQHPPERPLSEMFELRRFAISDGAIRYENRTMAGVEPLVFRGISADMGVTPQSRAVYAYDFRSSQPPFVDVKATGTMDIDRLILDLKQFALTVESKRVDGESALPPKLQQLVNELGVAGKISVNGIATIPFRTLAESSAIADVSIAGGRAVLPAMLGQLDSLDGRIHAEWREGQAKIRIDQLTAQSGDAHITVQQTTGRADSKRWEISGLSGQIDTRNSGPSTQPAPIANCYLLGGSIGFHGDASGDPDSGATYSLTAQPKNVTLLLPGFSKPIDSLHGTVNFSPGRIEFQDMQGNLLGGSVSAAGTIVSSKPSSYETTFKASNIDLEQLTTMPLLRDHSVMLSGSGELEATVKGVFPSPQMAALDHLTANGRVRITNGRVLDSKVVSSIAEGTGTKKETFTSGDAAAIFSIRNRTLELRNAAINTTVIGVQGRGTIGFDGAANLDVVAAPLGDWRTQVQNTGIPLVSDVAGHIAGGVQKLINTASHYLYAFKVTGNLKDPQVRPVPAPQLTNTAANMFGRMLQGVKSSDLLKSVEESQ